jgi:hypothetical protein
MKKGHHMSQRQMHLGVYAVGSGNHIAGWRYPGATTSGESLDVFKKIAASCERGKLDFIFVGDSLAFLAEGHPGQVARFEPTTLLSALSSVTSFARLPYGLNPAISTLSFLTIILSQNLFDGRNCCTAIR